MQTVTLFKFNKTSNIKNWKTINDGVMGGVSTGIFYLNEEGHGVYKGHISLQNNGGFSSLKYSFNTLNTEQHSKIILKVKGDGKTYQFRIKHKSSDRHSYIAYFNTSNKWQTICFNLSEMHPKFRGRKVNIPNYNKTNIEEIAFLIGNKKNETFKLLIDSIILI
ncbi:CIA30 family protein [Postechiella marina]|uniref:CIA30 family protein n=1 Tax=Postechiella marina TaxID=943941 RepID=A0ABP8BYT1_9FLAO